MADNLASTPIGERPSHTVLVDADLLRSLLTALQNGITFTLQLPGRAGQVAFEAGDPTEVLKGLEFSGLEGARLEVPK